LAIHYLSRRFAYSFSRLNPSPSFEQIASRQYNTIKGLIENRSGLAAELSPICFLQGSYRRQTAIYTINDVDIVALCQLWYPGSSGGSGKKYGRDKIFDIIAAPLLNDGRYKYKVRYHQDSMCIKVDLGIKVEILPVVYKSGNNDPQSEPFCLYRPEMQQWEDGYARDHQELLSWKNSSVKTQGNFIPAIKILKHLRSQFSLDAVSFHIECLLFSLPDHVFRGAPANYIRTVLEYISNSSAEEWYQSVCRTPCDDRDIFSSKEWEWNDWRQFHAHVQVWADLAQRACLEPNKSDAIRIWQSILGNDFFPMTVS
jgi:hypothetical protein